MMDLRKAFGLEAAEEAEENTVSYELFLTDASGAADGICQEDLLGLRAQLLAHLLPHTEDYIWQRDALDLRLAAAEPPPWLAAGRRRAGGRKEQQHRATVGAGARAAGGGGAGGPNGSEEAAPHLWGTVAFGDNLEDEWFVVWLLLELTRAFPVATRVWDNDGEFLLIEAAYSLPRWLKPESAANRVWLHGGALHIVPPPRAPGDPLLPAAPTALQALCLVCGGAVDTRASPQVTDAVLQRLEGFPGRAREQQHRTRVVVPARVAHVLRRAPQLAAPAVEAFHYRDVDDMRAAARMAVFPPQDMVPLRATLTRCLYAQLALQEFHPVRTYPMPLESDSQFKAAELGVKLTAGFEMLAAAGDADDAGADEAAGGAAEEEGASLSPEALQADPEWQGYLSRLQQSGFFGGHAPGSAQFGGLLQEAARRLGAVRAHRRRAARAARPAAWLRQLLHEPLPPASSYPPFDQLPPDDSEAWLREEGEQLEGELRRRQQEQEAHAAGKRAQREAAAAGAPGHPDFDPDALAARLRQFVEMAGAGLEGAEVPGDRGARSGRGAGGVELDEARFAAELARVLGLGPEAVGAVDADGVDSESSEEGSSFYSGSEGSSSESEGESEGEEEEAAAAVAGSAGRRPPIAAQTAAAAAATAAQQPMQQQQRPAQQPVRAGPAAAAAAAVLAEGERWEALTATDSDDEDEAAVGAAARGGGGRAPAAAAAASAAAGELEGGAESGSEAASEAGSEAGSEGSLGDFMDAYSQAMAAQLAPTTLGRSFARAGATNAGSSSAAAAAAVPPPLPPQQQQELGRQPGEGAGGAADAGEGGAGADLQPVDIDLNVVEGLLASFHSQGGLPGPASNLAGLLGISLPPPPPPTQQRR